MASFVRLVCKAEGKIGSLGVFNVLYKQIYVNTSKIEMIQTFNELEWKNTCCTHEETFLENMSDTLYVFVYLPGVLTEKLTNQEIWYGVHKDDVYKLGI